MALSLLLSTHPCAPLTTAFKQVQKFYPGMAIWQLSDEGISEEEIAAIQDPAHVLVMTASQVMQKTPEVIEKFKVACANAAGRGF